MTRYEKIKRYLETLHRSGTNLTDWERLDFLPSIARQFNTRGELSEKQFEILERIYDEKTPVGSSFGEPADDIIQKNITKLDRIRNEGRVIPQSELRRSWKEKGYDDED